MIEKLTEEQEIQNQGFDTENLQQETQESATSEIKAQENLSQDTQTSEQTPQEPASRRESDQEYNIRRMREERDRAKQERDEYLLRLSEMEKKVKPKDDEEEVEAVITEEELITGKQHKAQAMQIKQLKKEQAEQRRLAEELSLELKVRSAYPDFDKVCSPEAIEKFKEMDPELAAALGSAPNDYNKYTAVYKAIKKSGAHLGDKYASEKQAVINNNQRPRTSATLSPQTGATPLDHANEFASGLSEELKAKYWREMNEYSNY